MNAKTFPTGVVVITVTTHDGQMKTEDRDPKDHEQAREYAGELALDDEVRTVRYENREKGEDVVFVGADEVIYS